MLKFPLSFFYERASYMVNTICRSNPRRPVICITLFPYSREFGDYTRQGTVENVKVAKPFPMHSWDKSFANPAASTEFGMLNPPDLSKFGRSEQLHAALFGIEQFVINKD